MRQQTVAHQSALEQQHNQHNQQLMQLQQQQADHQKQMQLRVEELQQQLLAANKVKAAAVG